MTKSFSFAAVVAASLIAAPAVAGDWNGGYVGGQLGYAHVELSATGGSIDEDSFVGGLTAGYDSDFGEYVLGVGIDWDFADTSFTDSVGATLDVNSILRLKVRGGFDIGQGLAYATGGYAHIYGDVALAGVGSASFDESGYFIGGGYEHLITEQFSLGGEVLYNRFNDVEGSNVDAEAVTLQVRAAFRF